MSILIIKSGFDFSEPFEFALLSRNALTGAWSRAGEVLTAATIKASVLSQDKSVELIPDTAQANTGSAVWASGIVVIAFTAAATANLTPQTGWIQVSMVLSGIRFPYADIPVVIEKGWVLT